MKSILFGCSVTSHDRSAPRSDPSTCPSSFLRRSSQTTRSESHSLTKEPLRFDSSPMPKCLLAHPAILRFTVLCNIM